MHWLSPKTLDRRSAVVLACRRLAGSHTHTVITKALAGIISEFNLDKKVVRLTCDNASNFGKAFQ